MSLKVAVVTGGRADWGLLSPVVKAMQADETLTVQLVVTGQHLMGGPCIVEEREFTIDERVDLGLNGDTAEEITEALGRGVQGFAGALKRLSPDLMMVLGDRYEILGAVQAALIARIPVAHICGGDITEGAIDDSMRHAITKLSHLHFVSNEEAKGRVIQMGETPENVYCVGSPGLDQMHKVQEIPKDDFFKEVGLEGYAQTLLVTFHPVTLEEDSLGQCQEMLDALKELNPNIGLLFTASNADPEGQTITKMVEEFASAHENANYIASLGTERYFNALRYMDAVVGNSSSGLYEAPSFGMATVNIGNRQKGRLKASSVIDCAPKKEEVRSAIAKALSSDYTDTTNPYGDGHAAEKIVAVLKTIQNPQSLCKKTFHQL